MTPTNVSLGALDPARLSRFDARGRLRSGDAPTKESFLHLSMYGERADTGAVVHLHSSHATAVSILRDVDPQDVLPAPRWPTPNMPPKNWRRPPSFS